MIAAMRRQTGEKRMIADPATRHSTNRVRGRTGADGRDSRGRPSVESSAAGVVRSTGTSVWAAGAEEPFRGANPRASQAVSAGNGLGSAALGTKHLRMAPVPGD